ncbi:MAG: hypothetical protein M3P29_03005 [Acidobacteriota bacterium]|nr:hypothetical protein [Acidobacteriota bacterium]
MNRHLTLDEIEQYVARSDGVDEIIAIAEHLEACFECRDRAVAIVDPGDERSGLSDPDPLRDARRAITWKVVVICVAVVVVISAILVYVLQR